MEITSKDDYIYVVSPIEDTPAWKAGIKSGDRIIKIDDSYGIATIDPEIDCIVASEETLLRAEEINAIRFKKGLPKLTIVVVPIVVAEDGVPLSCDRISRGEIDSEGRILQKKPCP